MSVLSKGKRVSEIAVPKFTEEEIFDIYDAISSDEEEEEEDVPPGDPGQSGSAPPGAGAS